HRRPTCLRSSSFGSFVRMLPASFAKQTSVVGFQEHTATPTPKGSNAGLVFTASRDHAQFITSSTCQSSEQPRPLIISILALLILSILALLVAYVVIKVRRINSLLYVVREETRLDIENLFKQLSILDGLYLDLGLLKSLPPTRGFAAAPDFLREIVNHTLNTRPRLVVECSSGISTLLLARCMQIIGVGHVYSLEHLPEYAKATRANLATHGLADWATVLDAPLRPHVLDGKEW